MGTNFKTIIRLFYVKMLTTWKIIDMVYLLPTLLGIFSDIVELTIVIPIKNHEYKIKINITK